MTVGMHTDTIRGMPGPPQFIFHFDGYVVFDFLSDNAGETMAEVLLIWCVPEVAFCFWLVAKRELGEPEEAEI